MDDKDRSNMLVAMTPGGIELQEAAGQAVFAGTKELFPINCNVGTSREDLEALGFRFHENLDDLFCRVTLPQGWRKQATDHSMWTDILDETGTRRVAVFYKAAFYDRSAFASLVRD